MIKIEAFKECHLEGLVKIENECFETPWSETSLREQLDNPSAFYFVLTDDSGISGYGGLWHIFDEGDIMNIGVLPGKRRMGYGNMLVSELIKCMNERNMKCLNLEVRESNIPAINLYKKHGFYEIGRRKNYYQGKEDALLLRRDNVEYTGN